MILYSSPKNGRLFTGLKLERRVDSVLVILLYVLFKLLLVLEWSFERRCHRLLCTW